MAWSNRDRGLGKPHQSEASAEGRRPEEEHTRHTAHFAMRLALNVVASKRHQLLVIRDV